MREDAIMKPVKSARVSKGSRRAEIVETLGKIPTRGLVDSIKKELWRNIRAVAASARKPKKG